MSKPKKMANATCSCHESLAEHPCGACGELGHHRPLCRQLQEARQTGQSPCQLCNGRAHVAQNHYCQYCTSYPKIVLYQVGNCNYAMIEWVFLCGRNTATDSERTQLLTKKGHNHQNCPVLRKEIETRLVPNQSWLKITPEILTNPRVDPGYSFWFDLKAILRYEYEIKQKRIADYYYPYYCHIPFEFNANVRFPSPADRLKARLLCPSFLPRLHYWRQVPCLKFWWQDLAYCLLVKSPNHSPKQNREIFYRILILVSLFLNREARIEDEFQRKSHFRENCGCHHDYLNYIIVQLILRGLREESNQD